MQQGTRQAVTVFGKGVVLLGNQASGHLAKPGWRYTHFGMKHPREV